MIKTFEEFNWNIFKRKKKNDHSDVDPYGEEDWNDEDSVDMFKEFLEKENIYDEFVKYMNDPRIQFVVNSSFDELYDYDPVNYIFISIRWENTPEGRKYWHKKSKKWIKYYIKKNIK